MWKRGITFIAIVVLCVSGIGLAAQPVFTEPGSPWTPYRETALDPGMGPPYAAYRLDFPGRQPQNIIAYRLFTAHLDDDILGSYTTQVLKQTYVDATFTTPKPISLCSGLRGSSFSYTGDLRHDGHMTVTQELIAQGTAMYALIYRRPAGERDDPQAIRALASFCPPKDEQLPPPPPLELGAQYSRFSPPSSFTLMSGQTLNSVGWVDRTPLGTAVITARHDPTLFRSTAQYGAEQQRLADSHAVPLSGFTDYALLENHAAAPCAGAPTPRWYTKIRGNYYGTPAVAEQIAFVENRTLYSTGYLRPAGVKENADALTALQSLCPRVTANQPGRDVPRGGVVGGSPALTIRGKSLAEDPMDLNVFIVRSSSAFGTAQTIWKKPNEMPDYAPDFTFAGKDGADRIVIWRKQGEDETQLRNDVAFQARLQREGLASMIAAALEDGKGGSALQALVTDKTPRALMSVGFDLLDALTLAADQTVANTLATEDWLSENLVPGMSRVAAAAALKAKGIKSTTLVRTAVNCKSDFVTHWWYQGNYPYTDCAFPDFARPVISVTLTGHSEPGCVFSSYVDVLFDGNDKIKRLAISNPNPNCL